MCGHFQIQCMARLFFAVVSWKEIFGSTVKAEREGSFECLRNVNFFANVGTLMLERSFMDKVELRTPQRHPQNPVHIKEPGMPAGQQRNKHKQERQAFGLTILHPGHPEVRRLRHELEPPTLHGQKVWRASFLLMDYLQQRGLHTGSRVLELGCGWGLVGIYCAKTFNAHVTGLDADAAVFPYLQLHAQRNGVHIETRQCTFAHLPSQDLAAFDLIVGADICFWDELVDPIYQIVQHGVKAGVAEILVADPDRPPFEDLCARCVEQGNTQVFDWEITRPMKVGGKILRVVGNAARVGSVRTS
jgi:predicted nicotinamide N-methyase